MPKNIDAVPAKKLAGLLHDLLNKYVSGNVTDDHFVWFLKLDKLTRQQLSEGKFALLEGGEVIKPRTRCLSGQNLLLKPTDGKRTIARAFIFADVDPEFMNHEVNVEGNARGETPFSVCEVLEDSTLVQIFNSFSVDLSTLCFEQDQIIGFVRDHRSWLRTGGYATFFLFRVGGKFFVAYVYLDEDSTLKIRLYSLSSRILWDGRDRLRLVIPQPIPATT